ncbi:hypothetical protein [Streptomyces sp. NPDC006631]|uniref:hypothetical protein n=1 Tax=Streptomyces sp. NPDC006631 TaxID=3364752 RepID=UPI0036B1E9B5
MTTQNDSTEVSTQRAQFDSALRRILIRENLDGTEWAIAKLRVDAEEARRVAEDNAEAGPSANLENNLTYHALEMAAAALEKALDARTAELAARED